MKYAFPFYIMITRDCAMDVFSLNKCLMRIEASAAACVFNHVLHYVPNKPNPREVEMQIKCVSICSRESVEMVEKIAVELSKVDNDCMLYTPTAALADYESVSKLSKKLLRVLNNLKYKLQDKMKSCPDCELYQEQRADTFLEELQNFLQILNAGKSCSPRTVK